MATEKKYFALAVLFTSLFLSGCGQKGPLFLPDAEKAQQEQNK